MMRYFFYISDAKVNMLYDQIRSGNEKSETVFKGGIGNWLSFERHTENKPIENNTISKLEDVVEWIRKNETVSNLIDMNGPWIEDDFHCYVSYPVQMATNIPIVLLHYQAPFDCDPLVADKHMLLVGSAAYLMPRGKNELDFPTLPPGGHWTELATILSGILVGTTEEYTIEKNGAWLLNSTDGPYGKRDVSKMLSVRAMIRVLHKQQIGNKDLLLGTPLYVELTG